MATQSNGVDITLLAAADLTGKQFHFVKVDSAGKAALAALGENAVGVLQNKPNTGQAATIRVFGRSKMVADAAVAAGASIKSSSDAQGATASAAVVNTSDAGAASDPVIGSHVCGVALTAASNAGELFELLVRPMGAVPTTAA